MNYSLSSEEWEAPEESSPRDSQVIHQIEETIAKSRKVVEESIALTRKNNQRREQLKERMGQFPSLSDTSASLAPAEKPVEAREQLQSAAVNPLSRKLKEEESLRKEHERTILDLKSRVGLLESKQRVLGESPRVNTLAQLRQRIETAENQRNEFREEAKLLQETVQELEALHAREATAPHSSDSEVESLERELRSEMAVNERLRNELEEAKEKAEAGKKVAALEGRLTALESMYQAQVRLNQELESRLDTARPRGKTVLSEVGKMVDDHDSRVIQLQRRLQETESQCSKLRDVLESEGRLDSMESVIRKSADTDDFLHFSPAKKPKSKASKRPETAKKRSKPVLSDRPLPKPRR